MQLCAGDEMRIDVERDACLAAKIFLKPGAPGFGGFFRERSRGHHAKRCAIRELLPECLELRLGERREVLFDLSEPRLRANLRENPGDPSKHAASHTSAKVHGEFPGLRESLIAFHSECLAGPGKQRRRFAFGLGAARICRFFRLRRSGLEHSLALRGDIAPPRLDGRDLLLRLGFRHAGIGVLLVNLGAAGVDHPKHRFVKEAVQ